MGKLFGGTFIACPPSSSVIAVSRLLKGCKNNLESPLFGGSHCPLCTFAHPSAPWLNNLTSDPPAWFWKAVYPFSGLLFSLPSESLLCILP